MDISPIDKVPASFPITGTDDQGNPATLTNVAVALLPYRTDPTAATVWTPATITNGRVSLVLAGPAADPSGAVAVPTGGGYLWAKDTESSTVQAVRVGFVSVN